ncbi:XRE family transcriptional regulator [Weissella muntiaci]|uniref:XRE family transcriptional regulator n=1 Tax=Weissella muntiaci TaxID=2508881 RepID=A0A6C2C2F1_9LACO|nr:helix-turn-helix transcriptional regulator [Weissella muntiaci]TYC47987.1 XRE family transcriptional regulator [Weissella muntiaci]
MVKDKSLANALKSWRMERQFSVQAAADYAQMKRQTFARFENRSGGEPSSENMLRMAKILDVDPEEILRLAKFDKQCRAKQKDQQA